MNKLASPTPLYHRIYTVLRERIINGYYPADLPVPSEAELAQSFGVSRITIRKAMKILSDEGLVTRARGRGTFVTDHSQQHRLNRAVVSNINGLFNYLNTVGLSTTLRVISIDKSEAPPRIAVLMGIAPDAQIVRSVRVRDLDGRPYSGLSQIFLVNGLLTTSGEIAAPNVAERSHDFECHCRQAEAPIKGQLQRSAFRGMAHHAGGGLVSALSAQLSRP